MGRFRPLGWPEPRANIDRNRSTIRLAPHSKKDDDEKHNADLQPANL